MWAQARQFTVLAAVAVAPGLPTIEQPDGGRVQEGTYVGWLYWGGGWQRQRLVTPPPLSDPSLFRRVQATANN